MLSWSSDHDGDQVDVGLLGSGDGLGDDRLTALWYFATACAERDDEALRTARSALVEATDVATMVDAAAVAANFEMMTRLADSTGARAPGSDAPERAEFIDSLGMTEVVSRR